MCSNQKAPKEACGFYHQCALNRNFCFFGFLGCLISYFYSDTYKKTQIKLKDGGEVMKATGALFSTPFYPTASCRS